MKTLIQTVALSLSLLLAAAPLLANDSPQAVKDGVEFTYRDANAARVHWVGEFNGWNSSANPFYEDEIGVWKVTIPLPPGKHEYKFHVDGQWLADPANSETAGEYGNSAITVAADGKIAGGQAMRLPSALNSKLFIDGFYYAGYRVEEIENEGRMLLEKPVHDINLGLELQLNPSLSGRAELNINNLAEQTEMWRTHLNMQRASLNLTRPGFSLNLFDNEAVFLSDDPLQLVGKVSTWDYDYGYGARGLLFEKSIWADLRLLVADSGVDHPWRPEPDRPADSLGTAVAYNFAEGAGYRDDWILELSRDLGAWRAILLSHAVRGRRPGNLFVQEAGSDSTLSKYNYRTVQSHVLQALALEREWSKELSAAVELVWGRSSLQAKDKAWEMRGGEAYFQTVRDEKAWVIQQSRGLALLADWAPHESFNLHLEHIFQENRNFFEHVGDEETELSARALRYRLTAAWQSGDFRLSVDARQDNFHYDEGLGWGDQFCFSSGQVGAGNSWVIGNELPLERMTTLGYRSSSLLTTSLDLPLDKDLLFSLRGHFAATRLDRTPLYWSLNTAWDWRFTEGWSLLFDQRFATYDQDFLGLSDIFVDNFLELTWRLGKRSKLSLGLGVDPWRLDQTSKQMLPNGRHRFLADQGADEAALLQDWARLGSLLRSAENRLEDARQITLEAQYVF